MSWASRMDLGLAAMAGTVAAVGALEAAGPRFSVAAGTLTGGAVLGYRAVQRRIRRPETPPEGQPEVQPRGREEPSILRRVALGVACGLPFLVLFAPTLRWLLTWWIRDVWTNIHGLFVPFGVAYLVHRRLRAEPEGEPEASGWGLVLVAFGALMAVVDAAARTNYLGAFGLLVCLPGFSLALLGAHRTRALAGPLALSWLMIPLPTALANPLVLRQATAWGVEPLLHALGMPAFRDGTVIHMARQTIHVATACSGFSTLYASIAVALILAYLSGSTWRRVLLVVAAGPLALLANTLRVLALVLLVERFGVGILESVVHPASGLVAFCIPLLAMLGIAHGDSRNRQEPA